ncbi:sulfatase-like hydrolase/transferase [Salmonirosea aquatica]|uniref:sulfatase-like hydrolase/transferase n=1 Tax=Salmonirosea aquatica TaxID=2654236 RepID=UPI003571310E
MKWIFCGCERLVIASVVVLLGFVQPVVGQKASQRPPNIILILTDDMGIGDVGCYGGKVTPTPNIDRLASEGTRFTQYYSGSPICSPSRVSLTTGMHPARWNITSYLSNKKHNRTCEQADFLDPRAPSVARTLRQNGYHTAHFGKWHMGGGRDVTEAPGIPEYGFDEYSSTYESPDPDPLLTATNWIWSKEDSIKRWNRTAYFVDKTLAFLAKNQGNSSFVNLWLDDVHTPWIPDPEAMEAHPRDSEKMPNLQKVLVEVDTQIGRLMAGIKALGLDENTLVIFTSDNGPLPAFGDRRTVGLRGTKLSLFEGGIRMPFIVRYPGKVPAGRVDETAVMTATDLFPTFCKITQSDLPTPERMDGEDVSEAWFGKKFARNKPIYWEYGRNHVSFNYPLMLKMSVPIWRCGGANGKYCSIPTVPMRNCTTWKRMRWKPKT